jgi:hypothetical protein
MNHSNFIRALDVFAAAALLAGCSGAQPPLGGQDPGTLRAQVRAASVATAIPVLNQPLWPPAYKAKTNARLLYVTNVGYEDVTVYDATANNPEPVETISDGLVIPTGACVDGQGTLYVTNEPASNG